MYKKISKKFIFFSGIGHQPPTNHPDPLTSQKRVEFPQNCPQNKTLEFCHRIPTRKRGGTSYANHAWFYELGFIGTGSGLCEIASGEFGGFFSKLI